MSSLSVMLLMLFLALLALTLPFLGAERFFSMQVPSEWLAASCARQTRRYYLGAVLTLTLVGEIAAVALAQTRPAALPFVVLFQVLSLAAAWSWAWSQVLPFRVSHPVVRSAFLSPQAATRTSLLWAHAALLPLLGTAFYLLLRYKSIPPSFATHFSLQGVADHVVSRSWLAVFGPVAIGGGVILLLAQLLRAIEQRSAGIADQGRYAGLTSRILVAATWLISMDGAAVGLLPIVRNAGSYAFRVAAVSAAAVMLFLLAVNIMLIRNRSILVPAQSATDEGHWKGGLLYFNAEDQALFVPKRFGLGYTLNMARPGAWVLLGLTLLAVLIALALRYF